MDKERMKAFSQRVFGDMAATMNTGLAYVGYKSGLFKAMDGKGPMTTEQVVQAAGLHPRYVEEWLKGMAAGGMLDYFLNSEGTDHFMAGVYLRAVSLLHVAPQVADAFKSGGGVLFKDYPDDFHEISDMMNRGAYENRFVSYWMEQMPETKARLEAGGARALDFGCGAGRVPITLGKAYPRSTFIGVDSHALSIKMANELKQKEGAGDNVRFVNQRIDDFDADEPFDFISACDCIHDLEDPLGTLKKIRRLLKPEGVFFVIEPRVADDLEQNLNPIANMFYGISVFYCMTQSLAKGGPGLGTCYGQRNMQQLMADAGFTRFEVLNIKSPVNIFYGVRP
jgi:ubiquinone/menaquinone biosynthesis C-methylase UbiE